MLNIAPILAFNQFQIKHKLTVQKKNKSDKNFSLLEMFSCEDQNGYGTDQMVVSSISGLSLSWSADMRTCGAGSSLMLTVHALF